MRQHDVQLWDNPLGTLFSHGPQQRDRQKLFRAFRTVLDENHAAWARAASAGDAVPEVFDAHAVAERCMTYDTHLEHREVTGKKGEPLPKQVVDQCCKAAVEAFLFKNVLTWSPVRGFEGRYRPPFSTEPPTAEALQAVRERAEPST